MDNEQTLLYSPVRFLFFIVPASIALLCMMQLLSVTQSQDQGVKEGRLIGLGSETVDFAPYLSQRFEYDSNIFREESGEENDIISRTTPGFSLLYPGEKLKVDSSMSTAVRHYFENDDVDDDLDFRGFLNGEYQFSETWYTIAGASYDETNSPLDLTLEDQLTTRQTSFEGGVGRDGERLRAELLYRYQEYEVADIFDGLDWTDRGVNGSVSYNLSDPFRLRAGAEYGTQDYDEGLDNDYGEVTGGIQWNPNQTFGVIMDAGYRDTDYSSDENYDEYVLRGTALWKPVEKGRLKTQISHQPKESTLTNFVTSNELLVQYDQNLVEDWTLSSSASYDHRDEADSGVIQDTKEFYRFGLELTWSGLAEFTDLTGGYQYTKKEADDGVGEYDLNLLSLEGVVRF